MSLLYDTLRRRKVEPLFSETEPVEARRANAWLDDRFERSKSLPPGEFIAETMTITPTMAEVIQKRCNQGNRPLRPTRVAHWRSVISEGRWKVTSQGISFSRDGLLNNGQHRLSGIVAAGRPVKMHVVFGEDRDVFDVLDTGAVRGGSDTLSIAGRKNASSLAAAARLLRIVTSHSPLGVRKVDNDEILEIVEANSRLEEWTTAGGRVANKVKCPTAAPIVALFLIERQTAHVEKMENFIDKLVHGDGLNSRDPIKRLRDNLMRGDIGGNPGNNTRKAACICAAIILTWNLWVKGKSGSLRAMTWDAGTAFPTAE